MSKEEDKKNDFMATSRLIRRELRTKSNARFLRSMPLFRTDEELPTQFRSLLTQLRRAERAAHR